MNRRAFLLAVGLALMPVAVSAIPSFTFAVIAVIRPGDGNALKATPTAPVWTVGPEGRIFKDGVGTTGYAKQLLQWGDDIFAQGKTIPSWWRWNGLNWITATTMSWDALAMIAAAAPAPSLSGQVQPMVTLKSTGKVGTPK